MQSRFNQVANWQPYGGPGGFNDYDSIEVGNGAGDGLTPDERKTQMSLWAMGASPFILGTDLTNLDPLDVSYLKNTDVLAVDQDAIDASRVVNNSTQQVFTKTEPNGDVIVALFNTTTQPEVISTTATALGLPAGTDYLLKDLWTHQATETAGAISPNVPYRVIPVVAEACPQRHHLHRLPFIPSSPAGAAWSVTAAARSGSIRGSTTPGRGQKPYDLASWLRRNRAHAGRARQRMCPSRSP